MAMAVPHSFCPVLAAVALTSCNLAHPACLRKALRTLFVHAERAVVFLFCTVNVMRSVRASHLLLSSESDFTFIRNVALLARTHCVNRQNISPRMSASGAVASVAFPPRPTRFLIANKTAVLSHRSRTSSLRAADCNANTTPPNSGLLELVPSSSLQTRAHVSASSSWK